MTLSDYLCFVPNRVGKRIFHIGVGNESMNYILKVRFASLITALFLYMKDSGFY